MIVPDRKLVRRLRTRVRDVVKASPALRQERKRTRVGWRHRPYTWTKLRFLIPIAVLTATLQEPALDWTVMLLVFWTAIVVLSRAGQTASALTAPAHLWIFFHQPLSNEIVFRQQWRFVLRSSWWLGLDWLAFGLGVAVHSPSLLTGCAAAVLPLAQWACGVGLALTLARWWPRFPYPVFVSAGTITLVIILQTFTKPEIAVYIRPLLEGLKRATPAGWLALAFASVAEGRVDGLFVLLGLGGVGAALARWHWVALRNAFSLEKVFDYNAVDSTTSGETRWIPAEAGAEPSDAQLEPLAPAKPTAPVNLPALRTALTAALEQPYGWFLFRRGMLERFITRLLTTRQRVLVDFLQAQGFTWTRGWLIALGLIVLSRLLYLAGANGAMPAVLGLGGVALGALPLFGEGWLGFTGAFSFQARVGLHSFAPAGFWEIVRLLLTIALWRCVAAFPLLVLAVRYCVAPAPLDWSDSLEWVVRGGLVILGIQPVRMIAPFSKNSNDSSARSWFSALLIGGVLAAVLLVGSVGVTIFAVDSLWYAALAGLILAACTTTALLIYGWAFNRGAFDAVAKIQVA